MASVLPNDIKTFKELLGSQAELVTTITFIQITI